MTIEIKVPALGESVTEATVGKWFKKPGDAIKADEPIVELETDKVTVEVPAPSAGVLGDIKVDQGSTVAVGAVLGLIKEGAGGGHEEKQRAEDNGAHSKPDYDVDTAIAIGHDTLLSASGNPADSKRAAGPCARFG